MSFLIKIWGRQDSKYYPLDNDLEKLELWEKRLKQATEDKDEDAIDLSKVYVKYLRYCVANPS